MDKNSICIKLADTYDIPSLKILWKECFNVDDTYLFHVFSKLFKISTPLIYKDGNTVLSSLFFLPIHFKPYINSYIDGFYIYGVATRKFARGRHLSQLLINSVKEIAIKENKKFLITCPASNSLFSLYKRIGFNYEIFKHKYFSTPINICSIPFNIEKSNYIKYLQNNSINKGFIWPDYILDYIGLDLQINDSHIVPIRTIHYNTYCIAPIHLDYPINKPINKTIQDISPYILLMDLGLSKSIEVVNFADFIKYSFFNFPMR